MLEENERKKADEQAEAERQKAEKQHRQAKEAELAMSK